MRRYLRALSAVPMTALAASLFAGPVLARPPESSAGAGAQAPRAKDLTTGSIGASADDKEQKRFQDCMATWDPGTHMTKEQWPRTCNNAFEELPKL